MIRTLWSLTAQTTRASKLKVLIGPHTTEHELAKDVEPCSLKLLHMLFSVNRTHCQCCGK